MAEILRVKQTESIQREIEEMKDRVMRRAFDIFRGDPNNQGKELDDWLQAERELIWKPSIELEEKDNEFRLHVAVPGVDSTNIDIMATPEDILIMADTTNELVEEKREVYTCEFASGNLFRSIRLPRKIDANKVTAELNNGMLTVQAPIALETEARKIEVEAA